ncbi:carbonic anhydrase family protein [Saprospira sp. CCB-QB6]|uniref:carbonic anhydrase n=1 Tax=Saprospira sp. CCB-QB6 TaxID=3023936 RepID=UPI00234A42B0|nr:carbonic anhydrase family protein [Saprospira sp. CCB-QB6]WCL80149.1 carbonic anhydrase family protein [Saprospira sp. CCB-QB6]
MKTLTYLALIVMGLGLNACASKEVHINEHHPNSVEKSPVKLESAPARQHEDWSYQGETGPEHWAELEKTSDCGGQHQSPINIVEYQSDEQLPPLDIQYADQTILHDVVNNGHSIQYDFEEGDYIVLEGEKFYLKQFHFHEPSEHTIEGVRYPLEMHLVHANQDGDIAVLAVMAKEGGQSAPFDFLETYLPLAAGAKKEIGKPFDMNLNLPKDRSYYHYKGSLTTPPCSENVQWYIFKTPINISLKQAKILEENMPVHNYRNEQPVNDRIVKASPNF